MRRFKMIRTAMLAVLFLLSANIFYSEQVEADQRELAETLIRFHVRANSDSYDDQQLKLKVRDAVVDYMEELLKESECVEQSEQIIAANIEEILRVAMEIVHKEGYEYDLSGYIVEEYFPLRTYGSVTLPPGEYKAFRIDIGSAQGKNWWCVLYPPLCFVDVTHGVVPKESQEQLEEQGRIPQQSEKIVSETESEDVTYSVDFKYLKFLDKFLE